MTARRVIVWSACALAGAFLSDAFGLVKFTYPSVADEVHFKTTRTIVSADTDLIRTQEGDVFKVAASDAEKISTMNIWLRVCGNEVGIERTGVTDQFVLSYKRHTFICGTPFAALLTIPLIPVKVAGTYPVDISVVRAKEPNQPPPR